MKQALEDTQRDDRLETMSEATADLDPVDWAAFRRLAHQVVDDVFRGLETVRDRPVWQSTPASIRARLAAPFSEEGAGDEATYAAVRECVLPYALGNAHPRFFGWVIGSGTPIAVLAELVAAAMNPNTFGGDQAGTWVERGVIAWSRRLVGFPESASGLLVSGASLGNLVALAAARSAHADGDVQREGLHAAARRLVLYASVETHASVRKAVALLGLGTDALRPVPVTAAFEIDLAALSDAIARDRAVGHQPFCVVANAGTVNTGAIDPLAALADLCAQEDLWLHVDGAIGAPAALSPALAPQLRGMERADSVTFDFHKWLAVPYDASCVLVRDAQAHRRAFHEPASYLAASPRGVLAPEITSADYGPELSRPFRALKVWMALHALGTRRHAAAIERNVAQGRYLARLIATTPDELELLAPVSLNIVCFRYRAQGLDDAALDALNREIVGDLQETGVAVPSQTRIGGRFAIRVAIVNHRSRRADFDRLIAEVLALGRRRCDGDRRQHEGAA
jgi:glutamate/tyrosine decarboxylase-like PLP-dependent enzyme